MIQIQFNVEVNPTDVRDVKININLFEREDVNNFERRIASAIQDSNIDILKHAIKNLKITKIERKEVNT